MRSVAIPLLVSLLLMSAVARAEPERLTHARSLYDQGKALYERGDYDGALGLFERAYRLSRSPALLFNMAQAARLSGPTRCGRALELYRAYLARDARPSNAQEVRERIDEMRDCVSRAEPTPESARTAPVAPAPPPVTERTQAPLQPRSHGRANVARARARRPSTAAILVTGAGAALGVAGTILYVRARAKYDEAKAACPCPPGKYSSWETLTDVSYGLMAAGAATTLTGVSLLIWTGDGAEPAPRALGLRLSGHF